MTDVATRIRAARPLSPRTLAQAGVAALLALAAPGVSFLPSLTTGIRGSGAAISFPHGYAVMFVVTIAVTAAACAVGALLAGRAALVAIPLGLAWWALIGFALILAGLALRHHAHLTDGGIALPAAAVAGAVVGLPLAARR